MSGGFHRRYPQNLRATGATDALGDAAEAQERDEVEHAPHDSAGFADAALTSNPDEHLYGVSVDDVCTTGPWAAALERVGRGLNAQLGAPSGASSVEPCTSLMGIDPSASLELDDGFSLFTLEGLLRGSPLPVGSGALGSAIDDAGAAAGNGASGVHATKRLAPATSARDSVGWRNGRALKKGRMDRDEESSAPMPVPLTTQPTVPSDGTRTDAGDGAQQRGASPPSVGNALAKVVDDGDARGDVQWCARDSDSDSAQPSFQIRNNEAGLRAFVDDIAKCTAWQNKHVTQTWHTLVRNLRSYGFTNSTATTPGFVVFKHKNFSSAHRSLPPYERQYSKTKKKKKRKKKTSPADSATGTRESSAETEAGTGWSASPPSRVLDELNVAQEGHDLLPLLRVTETQVAVDSNDARFLGEIGSTSPSVEEFIAMLAGEHEEAGGDADAGTASRTMSLGLPPRAAGAGAGAGARPAEKRN